MLNFKTDTITISRLVEILDGQTYADVLSGLEVDIQPATAETVGRDSVDEEYLMFVETSDDSLIVYNDLIDTGTKQYIVTQTKFYKGFGGLPDSLEVIITEKKTGELII